MSPPIPIYMKVYFFVITNARQVQAGVEQPRLIERGPYSYVQHRKKVNITREGDIIRYSYTMYLCLYRVENNGLYVVW